MTQTKGAFFNGMEKHAVQFESMKEFNTRIAYIKTATNPKQHCILDVMVSYAAKYTGVCGLLNKTIAEKAGVTTRSVQRFTSKLQALGFGYKVINKRERSGGNAANYFVFNKSTICACVVPSVVPSVTLLVSPCQNDETPTAPTVKKAKIEAEALSFKTTLKQSSLKERKKRSASAHVGSHSANASSINQKPEPVKPVSDFLGREYVRNDIPEAFIDAVVIRDNAAQSINLSWKKIVLAFQKTTELREFGLSLEVILEDQDVLEDLVKRVRSAVRADKLGEVKKGFFALLYGTAKQLFEKLAQSYRLENYRNTVQTQDSLLGYDWLNEKEDEQQQKYDRTILLNGDPFDYVV